MLILLDKLKDFKATLKLGWLCFLGKPNKDIDKIYFNFINKNKKDKIYIDINIK